MNILLKKDISDCVSLTRFRAKIDQKFLIDANLSLNETLVEDSSLIDGSLDRKIRSFSSWMKEVSQLISIRILPQIGRSHRLLPVQT